MSAQIKERPILFSGAMVRALLDGSKTQTRRPFKQKGIRFEKRSGWDYYTKHKADGSTIGAGQFIPSAWLHFCPFGQSRDRLWVRENWFQRGEWRKPAWPEAEWDDAYWDGSRAVEYAADGSNPGEGWRSRPSIHMPYWASRILLEIESVRVERLQDCSKKDAIAEGIHRYEHSWRDAEYPLGDVAYEPVKGWPTRYSCPVQAYQALWESINGTGSWDTNPWVWVVEFNRVAP